MTLTARRPHWKVGRRKADYEKPDPDVKRYACFTVAAHAVEWWIEQLATRTVEELGGFDAAHEAHDWMQRQATWEEDVNPEEHYPHSSGWQSHAEIGGIEYVMALCACTGDVTGRCDNPGCDRDTDFDSEPYPGTMYTRWNNHCYRCGYGQDADGGYIGNYGMRLGSALTSRTPLPIPKHVDADRGGREYAARIGKLIATNDEWVGWWCKACPQTWHFTDTSWVSGFRLTRMWDGKVTGTEGYAITEADALAQQAEMNAQPWRSDGHCTVGIEKIEYKEAE